MKNKMNQQVLWLYTSVWTSRKRYIVEQVFNGILGLEDYHLTEDLENFIHHKGAKLCYGNTRTEGVVIPCSQWLEEKGIHPLSLTFKYRGDWPYAFEVEQKGVSLPFDLFALCFYLLSRYEEYLPFQADQHQRFTAKKSTAYKENFLKKPLVDYWALELKKLLLQHYPQLKFQAPTYRFIPSYDIDYAYAFREKGVFRQLGAFVRNTLRRDWSRLKQQYQTLLLGKKDPYDNFDYLQLLDERYRLSSLYFWLLGDRGTYDKNIPVTNIAFQNLVKKITTQNPYGIHPSYASNHKERQLNREVSRLKELVDNPVKRSRQHFLKLRFPQTYRALLTEGIEEEYSMGYAQSEGFRASTAHPFYWYDLEREETTTLKVHPFMLMDVTLRGYQGYSIAEAKKRIQEIIAATRKVDGQLISIWHNNSFCECWGWEGWSSVYEFLLEQASVKE